MDNKLSLQKWIDEASADGGISLGEYCLRQQAGELGMSEEGVLDRMEAALGVMEAAVNDGLKGRLSSSGLVGDNGAKMRRAIQSGGSKLLGTIPVTAVMMSLAAAESNACMGRIVAAPTAGSSGVLPGVLFAIAADRGFGRRQLAMGLVTAGAVGMVIASRATLSGAEGGCQAECGAAAAMAAGAVVDLYGGSPCQVGDAVAIALKNMLGLVCDPVAGLVEVPCVKRNAGAAVQGLAAAEMALCGISSAIPVDEVIDAMASVGRCMPHGLRETSEGGLAMTGTGRSIARGLCHGHDMG